MTREIELNAPTPVSKARKPKKGQGRPGRPTKQTDTTRARLLEAARAGYSSNEAICRAAGISTDTLARWAATDDALLPDIATAKESRLDRIENSVLAQAEIDPRVGLAVLKTRRSGYNDKARLEVTGADGGAIKHEILAQLPNLSDEQLSAAILQLEAAFADIIKPAPRKRKPQAEVVDAQATADKTPEEEEEEAE
ncbi:hypothetical protein UFOVP464_2 [uncultured Caudovirales phage]|uniref:Uncharacterized protein n=1 Tax=uncultured Caudovirales phage TaxID=2100421 RepID=A0A6J5RCA0_9CAUD|nr:hypothetical protein UFOVP464_2 [uncultured Caudovirales phage]CAB4189224.1 hypothetical protein UFOVP1189_17 [uncultured Caudovirales phage]